MIPEEKFYRDFFGYADCFHLGQEEREAIGMLKAYKEKLIKEHNTPKMKTAEEFYKDLHEYKELDKEDKYIVELMQRYSDYVHNGSRRGYAVTENDDGNVSVRVYNLSNIECIGITEFLKNRWLKGGE